MRSLKQLHVFQARKLKQGLVYLSTTVPIEEELDMFSLSAALFSRGENGQGFAGINFEQKQYASPHELLTCLNSMTCEDAVLNLLPRTYKTIGLFRAINAAPLQSIELRNNAVAVGGAPGRFFARLRRFTPGRLLCFMLRQPFVWRRLVGIPGRIIYGGARLRPAPSDALRLLSAQAWDYDQWLGLLSDRGIDWGDSREMKLEKLCGCGIGLVQQALGGSTLKDAPVVFDGEAGEALALDNTDTCTSPCRILDNAVRPMSVPVGSTRSLCQEKYLLFLDQNLPFHPDFKELGRKQPASAEKYFPALCNFFDCLEQAVGLPIIIAAHPRAAYAQPNYSGPDWFGGRTLVSGKTLPLIVDSALVLCHTSTALNFAVIVGKPVLHLTSRELEFTEGHIIRSMATHLHTRIINIDEPPKQFELYKAASMQADAAAYAHYFHNYIKEAGSPEKPFWQILIDDLQAHAL